MLSLIWSWIVSAGVILSFVVMGVLGYWIWKYRKLKEAIPEQYRGIVEAPKEVAPQEIQQPVQPLIAPTPTLRKCIMCGIQTTHEVCSIKCQDDWKKIYQPDPNLSTNPSS